MKMRLFEQPTYLLRDPEPQTSFMVEIKDLISIAMPLKVQLDSKMVVMPRMIKKSKCM